MNKLMMVVYVSTISHKMPESEIEDLLIEIRPRNERFNVSGLLLYCHGTFMQYLEGHEDTLTALYQRIKKDSRHHNVIQLAQKTIETREFENWSMGYATVSETVFDELLKADWLEKSKNEAIGRKLLRQFWKSNTVNPLSHL